MKLPSVKYLVFAILMCAWLAFANHRGWSIAQMIGPSVLRASGPSTQHK